MKDKLRLFFTYENKNYEKWIDIVFPPNLNNLQNAEHHHAFQVSYVAELGRKSLENWYKEITGRDFPNEQVSMREIVINE